MTNKTATESPLFAAAEVQEKHLSVTGLTKAIRGVIEPAFADVAVEGEISNFLNHRSGHRYWTLKDEGAQISCTFWKSRQLNFDVGDGQKVLCRGRISVYAPQGKYSLDVYQVRPLGIGALQLAYEKLFKKLSEEGLFDESRKRPIPRFPKKIGIVTSSTGAALHDILTAIRRRYPLTSVMLRASAVQGIGAELEIARAIRDLNLLPESVKPDVLIVGRGGGSLEDLWCFNEEAVARAIYGSKIPVISAVGHEVDVTIADFVADLRAPTPTAAAELATPDKAELLAAIGGVSNSLYYAISNKIERLGSEFKTHLSGYAMRQRVQETLTSRQETIIRSVGLMHSELSHTIELSSLRIANYTSSLRALDPKNVLQRGYAIARTKDGRVISSIKNIPLENFDLILKDGNVSVRKQT